MIKSITSTALLLFFLMVSVSHAQLRNDQSKASDYTGPVVKKADPSDGANLGNLFNMQMSHSYSVNFASFGGRFQNLNAYTNTMQFFFTDKLTGRVDLSLIHSPFSSNSINGVDTGREVQFILRNAELNYELSENSTLHLQFNQYPQGVGYYPGFGSNRNNPFRSTTIFAQ